jgi:nucleoside 2-deoxyribosyltransferase
LDGAQVDDGTASEIGFAYGIGKIIIGLRTDFRQTGEYFSAMANIQIEYFIYASCGEIIDSLD